MHKSLIYSLSILVFSFLLVSCEDEDGSEMDLRFKTGAAYLSVDTLLPAGSNFTVGVIAETEKKRDPLIKFNISESVNNGSSSTLFSKDLDTDKYEHDQNISLDTIAGNSHTFIFTVTNRDGFNAQEKLVITTY